MVFTDNLTQNSIHHFIKLLQKRRIKHLNQIRQQSFTRALSEAQIQEIKQSYTGQRGEKTILAKKYNVYIDVITRIVGKSYEHSKT